MKESDLVGIRLVRDWHFFFFFFLYGSTIYCAICI